jgi:hypothetical protein
MKERPILFNSEMVRAILDGRKTQTRRMVKPQPPATAKLTWSLGGLWTLENWPIQPRAFCNFGRVDILSCPFGTVGDRLWVREMFWINHFEYVDGPLPKTKPTELTELEAHPDQWMPWILYRADGDCCDQIPECECATEGKPKWRPSIHMPRWASRITLEITGVRVERLQEISSKDAIAEGVEYDVSKDGGWPLTRFQKLWDSVYGNWKDNPWVWVVEFKPTNPQ